MTFVDYCISQGYEPFEFKKNEGWVPITDLSKINEFSSLGRNEVKLVKGNCEIHWGLYETDLPPTLISPQPFGHLQSQIDRALLQHNNITLLIILEDYMTCHSTWDERDSLVELLGESSADLCYINFEDVLKPMGTANEDDIVVPIWSASNLTSIIKNRTKGTVEIAMNLARIYTVTTTFITPDGLKGVYTSSSVRLIGALISNIQRLNRLPGFWKPKSSNL